MVDLHDNLVVLPSVGGIFEGGLRDLLAVGPILGLRLEKHRAAPVDVFGSETVHRSGISPIVSVRIGVPDHLVC